MAGQYANAGGFFWTPSVVNVAHYADDLAPGIGCALADPFAQRGARIAPHFARQIFGNHRYVALVVKIGPGEIAPGDQRSCRWS